MYQLTGPHALSVATAAVVSGTAGTLQDDNRTTCSRAQLAGSTVVLYLRKTYNVEVLGAGGICVWVCVQVGWSGGNCSVCVGIMGGWRHMTRRLWWQW